MVDIVLIDDDELTRTALRLLAREAGFSVVGEAHDGVAGLAVVERLQPDLVCLDVLMPGIDGLSVLEKIKAAQPGLAVLMITASADPATVKRALALGADGFVVKPFNADRVVRSLHTLAREVRARRSFA